MSLKTYSNKPKSPLILDDDEVFIALLDQDPKTQRAKPLFARTGAEAQLILADQEVQIAGIFVNPHSKTKEKLKGPNVISVIKFAKRCRMNVPIYILCEKGASISEYGIDCKELGVKEVLEKPVSYSKILELVAPHVITFEVTQIDATKNKDSLDREVQESDSEFVDIRAKDFISGSKSFFSLYAKTGSGRYLKILHAGDFFEPERLASYFKKGVEHFYIRKEDQEAHLKFTETLSNVMVKKGMPSVEIQAAQTLNYGQETLKFLHQQGISESRLYHAANFVTNIQQVVGKMSGDQSTIAALMADIATYEHGVSTSMIASLVAHRMGIESDSAVQIVGISSMLHDIGLVGAGEHFEFEDIATMSQEQQALYFNHPKVGAEMMEKIPGTHPTVVQAILQHHERKGKNSFDPLKARMKGISGIAELIGITDEYLKAVHKFKNDPTFEIQKYMEKEVYRKFSLDTFDAFDKSLFPSTSTRSRKIA